MKMKTMNKLLFTLTISSLLFSCNRQDQDGLNIIELVSPVNASLRGLCPVNDSIAWFSGSGGTWLRTIDGGTTWTYGTINDSLDLRDIHAFNQDIAVVMNAGFPGLVLYTEDGGNNWKEVYRNETEGIFFDDISFMDKRNGVMFGDEIEGKLQLAVTRDGGLSWEMLNNELLPDAIDGEGGYAASGSLMITPGVDTILIATTRSRIISTKDFGKKWHYTESPIDGSEDASGIFSVATSDKGTLLVVGGNYLEMDKSDSNYGYSILDGAFLSDGKKPLGYRSGVSFIPGTETAIATGPTGTDISFDSGKNWQLLDSLGYHAIKYAPNSKTGWMSGSDGRIAKVK